MSATTTTPAPWTRKHELHIVNQVECRPAPDNTPDAGWMEARPTGLVHILCNCGYSSGWIPREQVPTREQLLTDHGTPQAKGEPAASTDVRDPAPREAGAPRLPVVRGHAASLHPHRVQDDQVLTCDDGSMIRHGRLGP